MAKKPNTTSEIKNTKNALAETSPSVRPESKKTRLIDMLRQPNGTTIAEISTTLGWQPHTTRAAITGLRKLGHEVETDKPADGTSGLIYRIALGSDAEVTTNSSAEASQ